MPSIYATIRQAACKANIKVDESAVCCVAGTFRAAGLEDVAGYEDLLLQELKRVAVVADTEVSPTCSDGVCGIPAERIANAAGREAAIKQIDASLQSGKCPRCGQQMREVKLADYTPALHCTNDCKITLWRQTEKQSAE